MNSPTFNTAERHLAEFSVTAFMTVFNEADILPWTIRHLIEQGVAVYVIDNWSTDDSAKIAQAFPLVGYERFPTDGHRRSTAGASYCAASRYWRPNRAPT